MRVNNFNDRNRDRRSGQDRRPHYCERSVEEKLLNGKGRFKRPPEVAEIVSRAKEDVDDVASERRQTSAERRSGIEGRSRNDRRCGFDTRSEVERFLQGERRSGLERRSRFGAGYQSFKKARAFVRSLKLNSLREWQDYANSDAKPNSIPTDPESVYANDGWAGWNDWLGSSRFASYMSEHRLKFSAFGVGSD